MIEITKLNVDSLRVQKVMFSNKRRPRSPRTVEPMMKIRMKPNMDWPGKGTCV
jgi:hypothetical protein